MFAGEDNEGGKWRQSGLVIAVKLLETGGNGDKDNNDVKEVKGREKDGEIRKKKY